jgi:hypothetical protein
LQLHFAATLSHRVHGLPKGKRIRLDRIEHLRILRDEVDVANTLRAQVLLQLVPLMDVVDLLHALLERDCNQQADRDRAQVDPEISPAMHRAVWWVDFHGYVSRRQLRLRQGPDLDVECFLKLSHAVRASRLRASLL